MPFNDQWLGTANLLTSLALLVLGLVCLATCKRVIKQVISLNIMLQGALLALIEAGRENDRLQDAQNMMISALIVEVIITAIALALIINVFRFHPSGHVDDLDTLRG